jgi:hypothetical protein
MDNDRYEDEIRVYFAGRCLEVYANTNATFEELLAEGIDNPIAARVDNFVEMYVEIKYSHKSPKSGYVLIRDTASGMTKEGLQKALCVGIEPKIKGLNEHGVGLQTMLFGLGKPAYIKTKVAEDSKAILVDNYNMENGGETKIGIKYVDWDVSHGTEILINNLKMNKLPKKKDVQGWISIINRLQAKYRYYLCGKCTVKAENVWAISHMKDDQPRLKLHISIVDLDAKNNAKSKFNGELEALFPAFIHPETKENKPYINYKELKGPNLNWSAAIAAGWAPTKKEAVKQGLSLDHTNPYGLKAGFDIIKDGRIILSKAIKEIGINLQSDAKNSWMGVRGEIHLDEHFSTCPYTKTLKLNDEYMDELKQVLGDYFREIDFYQKGPSKEATEYEMVDRWVKLLIASPQVKKVEKGCNASEPAWPVDAAVTMTDEKMYAYEFKPDKGDKDAVFQAYSRFIMRKSLNRPYEPETTLIAPYFTPDAIEAAKAIEELGADTSQLEEAIRIIKGCDYSDPQIIKDAIHSIEKTLPLIKCLGHKVKLVPYENKGSD